MTRFTKSIRLPVPKGLTGSGAARSFPTRTTALSQVCHCGYREKKPLHQRWHRCPACGAVAQRDLYSAYLASFVEPMALSCNREIWLLNAGRAKEAWPGGDALLHPTGTSFGRAAFERLQADTTNGQVGGVCTPSSLGLKESLLLGLGSEPVAAKAGATVGNRGSHQTEAQDVPRGLPSVVVRGPRGQESLGKVAMGSSGRTPPL